MDIWGAALWDYHSGDRQHALFMETSYGPTEKVPLEEFYRTDLTFNKLELYALELCQGTVLDIGAGAGAHSLQLQSSGLTVEALEYSPGACKVMKDRGVDHIIMGDFWQHQAKHYQTLLLLMNGAGMGGTLKRLDDFLITLRSWISGSGQILMDSCDVQYLFDQTNPGDPDYYGNLTYKYVYRQQNGKPFPWLFVDFDNLKTKAHACGLQSQLLYQDGAHYLARLTPV